MYRSTTHTYTCPCGQDVTEPIYEYVNVSQDPKLRYVVLAGLLNVAICPCCGRRMAVPCPFVYSDPQYNFLAYVHPRADAPAEARQMILERLRLAYVDVASTQVVQENSREDKCDRMATITAAQAKAMPPLKVVFGLDRLQESIGSLLSPEDRLGRLALNTHSRDAAERAQFLIIMRKLASEMDCNVDVEDQPDEYTVRLYGSRRHIGSLMRSLTAIV